MSSVRAFKGELTLDDLVEHSFTGVIAGFSSPGFSKRIEATARLQDLSILFRVYVQRRLVLETTILSSAIEAFNEAGFSAANGNVGPEQTAEDKDR